MFCQNCGNELNTNAVICVNCGISTAQISAKSNKGHISLPIISLIAGILGILTFFDDSGWDLDTIIGCIVLWAIVPIILGLISIKNDHNGKGMGVAGLVLGIISGLGYLSLLSDYL
jgi:uncharacterized membrane protein HdeD (DUF308 family)|tara:strand:+ start:176 stop:523 length:348 start_codon:yes stop_codon:yes gene_type:complete